MSVCQASVYDINDIVTDYNRAVSDVPHCYPIATGDWEESGSGLWLVALKDGQIRGLSYVSMAEKDPIDETENALGTLGFFWYQRGCRSLGQELLQESENWLTEHGAHAIQAFHYDHTPGFYHAEHAYLSSRMEQVSALLGNNGYTRGQGEVVLDWPNYRVDAEDADCPMSYDIALDWEERPSGQKGLTVWARRENEDMGICVCTPLSDQSPSPLARNWTYTRWLAVDPDIQHRGLGSFLVRRALAELYSIGYRHATICCIDDNYRALLLYSNLGYQAVDWTYTWRKKLAAPSMS